MAGEKKRWFDFVKRFFSLDARSKTEQVSTVLPGLNICAGMASVTFIFINYSRVEGKEEEMGFGKTSEEEFAPSKYWSISDGCLK